MTFDLEGVKALHAQTVQPLIISRRNALAGLAGAVAALPRQAAVAAEVDLSLMSNRLETLVRATGDASGRDSILWSHGAIFAWIPGQGGYHLFDLDFVSVRRWEKLDNGGWRRLSKEAGLYLDKDTGEVLDTWYNPFIERDVEVFHILNDPFVRDHVSADAGGTWAVENWEMDGSVCLWRSVLISRDPDLQPAEYPLYAQADTYDFAEMYSNVLDRADINDLSKTSIPVMTANTRVGQWVPWMEMGQRQGWQINQLRGKKLNRVDDIPAKSLAWLEKNASSMLEAPQTVTGENINSWKSFKEKLARDRAAQTGEVR